MTPDFQYPDAGNMLEDKSVLRNALTFTLAQRAFLADHWLHLPLDQMAPNVLAFVTLEAFGAQMTACEDTLGWLFALRDWQPGTAARSLIANLDTIQVGRNEYDEAHAFAFLASIDAPMLRQILHIPADDELRVAGLSDELIAKVETSLPHKLDGLRRIVDLRSRSRRTQVEAFNKLKHMLLAFPSVDPQSNWHVQLIKGRGYEGSEIHLNTVTLEVSPANVKQMAGDALAMQVQLWDILSLILWVRFGEKAEQSPWLAHALDHGYWRE